MSIQVYLLRIIHGLFAAYFLACLIYLYVCVIANRFDIFLMIAVISLAGEGFVVFILNKGDCPLIHIQKRIGDEKPFFELFLPPSVAKQAIPFFATLAWIAVAGLLFRVASH